MPTTNKNTINYIKEQLQPVTNQCPSRSQAHAHTVKRRRHFTNKLLLHGSKTRFTKQSIVNINKIATKLCR